MGVYHLLPRWGRHNEELEPLFPVRTSSPRRVFVDYQKLEDEKETQKGSTICFLSFF